MTNMRGTFYALVIDGTISEKGSKRDMLRRVRAVKATGGNAFLGYTPRPAGSIF